VAAATVDACWLTQVSDGQRGQGYLLQTIDLMGFCPKVHPLGGGYLRTKSGTCRTRGKGEFLLQNCSVHPASPPGVFLTERAGIVAAGRRSRMNG
jgi:hypothetical protein